MSAPKDADNNAWPDSPQGRAVFDALNKTLAQCKPVKTGEVLVQMGSVIQYDFSECLGYKSALQVSIHSHQAGDVWVSPDALPFDRHSIDCLMLPFFLEQIDVASGSFFDEVERVMKACGTVIVWGINPFGLWGYARHLFRTPLPFEAPHLVAPLKIKQQFASRGFIINELRGFYYLPPLSSVRWLQRFEFLNEIGMMVWPFPASFYLMVLQKQTLITPAPLVNLKEEPLPLSLSIG